MAKCKPIAVAQLFSLWADQTLTRAEVAHRLGISHTYLTRLIARHKLPPRAKEHKSSVVDPTPDEIAERARQCREKHYAERRSEPWDCTVSKVSKWRAGICMPSQGRHA